MILSLKIFSPQIYIKKEKKKTILRSKQPLPKIQCYLWRNHILRRVILVFQRIAFLIKQNHLFTIDPPVECDLGWREILIVNEISCILEVLNGCIPTKVRSSGPLINITFLDPDRSSFLADVDCHFFLSISVSNIFLASWANVFLAE